jgi:hypothetical protein
VEEGLAKREFTWIVVQVEAGSVHRAGEPDTGMTDQALCVDGGVTMRPSEGSAAEILNDDQDKQQSMQRFSREPWSRSRGMSSGGLVPAQTNSNHG